MTRALAVLTLLLASALPVAAQTPTVTTGVAYQVAASHSGQNTAGYRLYVDSAKVADVPVSQLSNGTITITAPPLTTRGSHTLTVSAYNADNEVQSTPLAFQGVLPAPGQPSGVTIIINITIPQGPGQ